jgi:hypothetical protein
MFTPRRSCSTDMVATTSPLPLGAVVEADEEAGAAEEAGTDERAEEAERAEDAKRAWADRVAGLISLDGLWGVSSGREKTGIPVLSPARPERVVRLDERAAAP